MELSSLGEVRYAGEATLLTPSRPRQSGKLLLGIFSGSGERAVIGASGTESVSHSERD